MNIKKLAASIAATAAAVLSACGGGGSSGGIGGTGNNPDVAVGTITQFGSVWVNGVEYSTSDTTFKTDDFPNGGARQSDLREGMVVRIDGSIAGKRAGELVVSGAVKGFVERVIDANQMIVMGQTIQIDTTTKFENGVRPVAGNRVDVHGLVAGDGVISAGYIERKTSAPTPPFAVKGVVKNHVGQEFQVGTLTVVYAGATIGDMPAGSWNGLEVEVKGGSTACAGSPVCGTLVASQVEPSGVDVRGAEKAEIEGVVSAVSAGGFTLGGVPVTTSASTRYEGGLAADLLAGTKVEVEGSVSGGTIVATKVSFRDAIRIEGDVASVSGNTLTISGLTGVTVTVTSITELKDLASVGDLAVGNHLRLRGKLGTGNSVVASRLELRSTTPDRDVELQAPATAVVADASVTLLGVTVPAGSNIEAYQDTSEVVITKTEFFAGAKVGTLIKAKGRLSGSVLTWRELQLEN